MVSPRHTSGRSIVIPRVRSTSGITASTTSVPWWNRIEGIRHWHEWRTYRYLRHECWYRYGTSVDGGSLFPNDIKTQSNSGKIIFTKYWCELSFFWVIQNTFYWLNSIWKTCKKLEKPSNSNRDRISENIYEGAGNKLMNSVARVPYRCLQRSLVVTQLELGNIPYMARLLYNVIDLSPFPGQ